MSKVFTAAQVEEHSDRTDLWMTIHGKVYDVTKFLDDHPGGEEVLTELAGRDATDAFEEIDLLKQFLVGELDKKDFTTKPKTSVPKSAAASETSTGP
ncbi:hypothetical protein HDV04_001811 [Boothiomyces sp. JEL0838]|nr:hypothetical protein HDV04_001811 [Boothiomyces sp. JEL0838]